MSWQKSSSILLVAYTKSKGFQVMYIGSSIRCVVLRCMMSSCAKWHRIKKKGKKWGSKSAQDIHELSISFHPPFQNRVWAQTQTLKSTTDLSAGYTLQGERPCFCNGLPVVGKRSSHLFSYAHTITFTKIRGDGGQELKAFKASKKRGTKKRQGRVIAALDLYALQRFWRSKTNLRNPSGKTECCLRWGSEAYCPHSVVGWRRWQSFHALEGVRHQSRIERDGEHYHRHSQRAESAAWKFFAMTAHLPGPQDEHSLVPPRQAEELQQQPTEPVLICPDPHTPREGGTKEGRKRGRKKTVTPEYFSCVLQADGSRKGGVSKETHRLSLHGTHRPNVLSPRCWSTSGCDWMRGLSWVRNLRC